MKESEVRLMIDVWADVAMMWELEEDEDGSFADELEETE